jgi:HEPN domain-containing protein
MAEQTAVDWLYNMMLKPLSEWPDDLWEQAKEMEKDYIKMAYNAGYVDGCEDAKNPSDGNVEDFDDAEKYYNDIHAK